VPGRPGCLVTESAPGRPGYTEQVPGLTGCLWGQMGARTTWVPTYRQQWVPGRPGCPVTESVGCQDDLGARLSVTVTADNLLLTSYQVGELLNLTTDRG
jgi:hypothetical protein